MLWFVLPRGRRAATQLVDQNLGFANCLGRSLARPVPPSGQPSNTAAVVVRSFGYDNFLWSRFR
jgi:hypothetical protein